MSESELDFNKIDREKEFPIGTVVLFINQYKKSNQILRGMIVGFEIEGDSYLVQRGTVQHPVDGDKMQRYTGDV